MIDWSFDAWPAVEPKWHDGAERIDPWDTQEFHVDLGCGTVKKARIGIDRYPAPGVNVVMDLDQGRVAAQASHPGQDAASYAEGLWLYEAPDRTALVYPAGIPEFSHGPSGWQRSHGRSESYTISCGLPFANSSIESIISHHALEHIGEGFLPLMDDIYRVLKPGGLLRAIVPLFPSYAAVSDPDHCRYFMEGTFDSFCGHLGSADNPTGSWLDSFSVPYTQARFEKLDERCTPRVEPDKHWSREDAREMRVALRAVK